VATLQVPIPNISDTGAGASAPVLGERASDWMTLATEAFPFAPGEVLRLRAVGPAVPGSRSFLVLDRAEVVWR
jgi:hypothetical protein